jgi:hypothetical protein
VPKVNLQVTKNVVVLVVVNLVAIETSFDHHKISNGNQNLFSIGIHKVTKSFQLPTIWRPKPFSIAKNYNF